MGNKIIVKPGDRYGKLAIVEEVQGRTRASGDVRRMFRCLCDCGNYTTVPLDYLRKKRAYPACGCRRGYNGRGRTTHGFSRTNSIHPLYRVWSGMIGRCETPTAGGYDRYGGRGIYVCHEWHSFEVFMEWALLHGWEKGTHIERIDNNGHYSPDNCCFVTPSQNQRNKFSNRIIAFNGETLLLVEWSERLGIAYGVLNQRINILKWPIERALTEPVRTRKSR